MLNWANRFNICCFLDNHNYHSSHHSIECMVAAGAVAEYHSLDTLPEGRWLFGHLAYDLKNEIEELRSDHPDHIGFPHFFFFEPEYLIRLSADAITVGTRYGDHRPLLALLLENEGDDTTIIRETSRQPFDTPGIRRAIELKTRFSKEEYVRTVAKIREHILRGDCYELNLCQEFFVESININPVNLYLKLGELSPHPFSAYYKRHDQFALCGSPERFLKKEGMRIISQPMKGTSARHEDPELLRINPKERAENIMIVDLVRNDLSRICTDVEVEELCAVYSFPHVHQMISTVSGKLREGMGFGDIVRASFPMGSMTGAPKKRVMELIEKYELSKRGLFSGSIGYIDPYGDFDLNVVIRSALYNGSSQYLSYQTGSAITFNSEAGKEYEECLLKASSLIKALNY